MRNVGKLCLSPVTPLVRVGGVSAIVFSCVTIKLWPEGYPVWVMAIPLLLIATGMHMALRREEVEVDPEGARVTRRWGYLFPFAQASYCFGDIQSIEVVMLTGTNSTTYRASLQTTGGKKIWLGTKWRHGDAVSLARDVGQILAVDVDDRVPPSKRKDSQSGAYFVAVISFSFVWFGVAIICGLLMVVVFPPDRDLTFVGIATDWRNLPGMILGFYAGLHSARASLKAGERPPPRWKRRRGARSHHPPHNPSSPASGDDEKDGAEKRDEDEPAAPAGGNG